MKRRLEKSSRLSVRAGKFRFRVTKYDYYAVIVSAFTGAVIYMTITGRMGDALILTSLLSGVGLSEILRMFES